jgi:hypothetical protein
LLAAATAAGVVPSQVGSFFRTVVECQGATDAVSESARTAAIGRAPGVIAVDDAIEDPVKCRIHKIASDDDFRER